MLDLPYFISVAHRTELELYLKALNFNFNIIGLCETWLKETNCNLYNLPGYVSEHCCRKDKNGGGVALYIQENVNYMRRIDIESVLRECNVESVFIEISKNQFGTKSIVVGEIYRPPGDPMEAFNTSLELCLMSLNREGKLCYLLGDYNVNLLNANKHAQTDNLINTMFSQAFVPLINRPTRVTVDTATLIDHIYTNALYTENYQCINGILLCALSDHFPIFHICERKSKVVKIKQQITTHVINTRTLHNLKTDLGKQDWTGVMNEGDDVNKAYNCFYDIFHTCYSNCIPVVTKELPETDKPWITTSLLNSIKRKNKLYKQYLKFPCTETEMRYKQYKNKLTHLLRISERTYVTSYLEEHKDNLKKTWKIVNEMLCKRVGTNMPNKFMLGNNESENSEESR